MVFSLLTEGLIYGMLSLSVYITFRLLDFPDLTVDGSFPLGAAIAASLFAQGFPTVGVYAVVFLGGILAGVISASIHNRFSVPPLLAGIITMTMLWSINIRILGNRSNLPLLRVETSLSRFSNMLSEFSQNGSIVIYIALAVLSTTLVIIYLLHTKLGLALRAMGDNEQMSVSYGYNKKLLKVIGVGIANGLAAFSGSLIAQNQGFADVGMGRGIVIVGLVSLLIGEFLYKTNFISLQVLRVFLGALLFRVVLYFGRVYGYSIQLLPTDLQLLTGITIILLLSVQHLKERRK